MSLEDDTDNGEVELRELVIQTLEENDFFLTKIKAQLRAGLYLALENEINTGNQEYNETLQKKLRNSPDLRILFSLVREFLEYFGLNYTCSVFEKETFMGSSYEYENREKLIQELDIGIDSLRNSPLLLELLNLARNNLNISVRDIKFNSTEHNDAENNKNSTFIVAQTKSDQTNCDTNSSSDTSQHFINVKTIPKREETNAQQNGDKTESIIDEKQTQQTDIIVKNGHKLNDVDNDDTYEGTSSIAEDSVPSSKDHATPLIDFDKSIKPFIGSATNSPPMKNIIDQSLEEIKSPRLSDQGLSSSSEKKKSEKSDPKLKPMSALSSLGDLPPLQLNKSRNSDTMLLPSLYSKREKSGIKDFDKLFDMTNDSLDNYEEDFLSSTSLGNSNESDLNIFLPKQNLNNNKNESRPILLNKNDIKCSTTKDTTNENGNMPDQESNTTTISEEFDINSNVDDNSLKSNSTT